MKTSSDFKMFKKKKKKKNKKFIYLLLNKINAFYKAIYTKTFFSVIF